MTEEEFKQLKPGDAISCVHSAATIEWIETDYDWSAKPPTKHTWAVHLNNGTNARITDDLTTITKIN